MTFGKVKNLREDHKEKEQAKAKKKFWEMMISPAQKHKVARLKIETRLHQLEQMKRFIDKNNSDVKDDVRET